MSTYPVSAQHSSITKAFSNEKSSEFQKPIENSLEERIRLAVIKAIRKIVDTSYRFTNESISRKASDKKGEYEGRGVWRSFDYYDFLVRHKDKGGLKRLERHMGNGSFYHPVPPKGWNTIPTSLSPTGQMPSHIRIGEKTSPDKTLDIITSRESFCMLDTLQICQASLHEGVKEGVGSISLSVFFPTKREFL